MAFTELINFGKYSDKRKLFNYLKTLDPTVYEIRITKKRKQRSNDQNAYYWGVCVDILCNELGWFKNEMHDYLLQKFAPKKSKYNKLTKETHWQQKTSSELSTKEFSEYCDTIQIWAKSECGIHIPDPNEEAAIELIQKYLER